MNYCSHCGSATLVFSIPQGDNRPRYHCGHCQTIHYQNPKVVTGCLPVWENNVLLCRRAITPRKGYWNIPSGYLENGESVAEGAKREVWEEAAARVNLTYLITLYDLPKINQVYLQFIGELLDGAYGVGEESLECSLFAEHEIPWEEMAFTSSLFTLRRYFEDRENGVQKLRMGVYPEE